MPIRVFNWDRQAGNLLDPAAAMKAGVKLGPSAALTAISNAMAVLNDYSVKHRVAKEVELIKPTLDADIVNWADNNTTGYCYDPADVGVILHIIIAEYSAPIGMSNSQLFWTIIDGDAGLNGDAEKVFKTYMMTFRKNNYYPPVDQNAKEIWHIFWYTQDSPDI
jgi:hypothetical protein